MLQNQATAKAAIYARRSPEDRANRQNQFRGDGVSDSIESQLLLLHQYADNQGFTNCREYYDDNISGTTFARPQFMKMLADIEAGSIDTVIVKDDCDIIRLNAKPLWHNGLAFLLKICVAFLKSLLFIISRDSACRKKACLDS